jgi:hypothetical protein
MIRRLGIFALMLTMTTPAMALDILVTDAPPEAATQPGDSGDSELTLRPPTLASHTGWVEPALIGTGIFLALGACAIPLAKRIL